jgi:hypothetical protein
MRGIKPRKVTLADTARTVRIVLCGAPPLAVSDGPPPHEILCRSALALEIVACEHARQLEEEARIAEQLAYEELSRLLPVTYEEVAAYVETSLTYEEVVAYVEACGDVR